MQGNLRINMLSQRATIDKRLGRMGIDSEVPKEQEIGAYPVYYGNTAQWELRASADFLPQSCSMKNGKYNQYSRIFHTFDCAKISRRISLPHYAVLPYAISSVSGLPPRM